MRQVDHSVLAGFEVTVGAGGGLERLTMVIELELAGHVRGGVEALAAACVGRCFKMLEAGVTRHRVLSFAEHHVSILDDWTTILVEHMLLSERAESDILAVVENHISGSIKRIWCPLALLRSVDMPIVRVDSSRLLARRMVMVDNESATWSLNHLQLGICGNYVKCASALTNSILLLLDLLLLMLLHQGRVTGTSVHVAWAETFTDANDGLLIKTCFSLLMIIARLCHSGKALIESLLGVEELRDVSVDLVDDGC